MEVLQSDIRCNSTHAREAHPAQGLEGEPADIYVPALRCTHTRHMRISIHLYRHEQLPMSKIYLLGGTRHRGLSLPCDCVQSTNSVSMWDPDYGGVYHLPQAHDL
eukprot:13826-Eustigmatos_ZCMA.PRE.1